MKTNKKGKRPADINDLFTLENIKAFIRYIESADIAEIKISVQDKSLFIGKHRTAGPAPQPAAVSGPPMAGASWSLMFSSTFKIRAIKGSKSEKKHSKKL